MHRTREGLGWPSWDERGLLWLMSCRLGWRIPIPTCLQLLLLFGFTLGPIDLHTTPAPPGVLERAFCLEDMVPLGVVCIPPLF